MRAAEWIDRVKAKHGWTDYKAAQELGISGGAMSQIRTGNSKTLGEETAISVARALGERPEAVLLDQYAERTKNPEVRSALLEAGRRLCILCKVPDALNLLASAARATGVSLSFC